MTKAASYFGRQTRPRTVSLTFWGMLGLGLANGWRAIGLGQRSDLLLALDASLNPWLGLVLALFWCILILITAVALWQRRKWTRFMVPLLLLIHGIYQVGLVLLFARSAASRNAWPLIGLLFTLVGLFSFWALYRPSVRWYYKK